MTKNVECMYLNTLSNSRFGGQEERYIEMCDEISNSKIKRSPIGFKIKNKVYFKEYNV